jgi:2-keto-4-pentenoate hydratase/2-oxohepta-3-ene-1,7-dioic acid hydratase in catechol pathway
MMKLVRYGQPGKEKPGLIDNDGKIRDLSAIVPDFDGEHLDPKYLDKMRRARVSNLPLVRGKPRLGAPIARPGNFVGVGLNYSDHAAEAGLPIPTEPILFIKASNCISGPHDPIVMPKESTKLDYETELAIVIGTRASQVSERAAMDYVAGFCLANDVSERAFQMDRGGQWTKGKSAPTFGPLGPWLVTPDEIENVQRLNMWLDVNGARRQTGNTKKMIFSVKKIVSYISNFMVLEPGDVIVTGTPPGVGMGMKPPKYLQVGDVLTLGIEGLGEQRQEIIAWKRGM